MERTQVGHYRIEHRLGGGAMGEVYKAEDLKLDRRVALKFVAPSLIGDEDSQRRFEREAKSAAALNHPHIAILYALERDGDQSFLSMELLEGTHLRAIMSGPLPIDQATVIVRDVASALAYAHSRGVVHRDIKPENLMFDGQHRIKITDFGLAKASHTSTITQMGTSVGTPAYMAPECAHGESGAASDVFALGVVFYELLAGRPPFVGSHPLAIMFAIASQEPPPLRDLRPDADETLASLVMSMLAKPPEDRPTAARVAAALGGPSALAIEEAGTIAIDSSRAPHRPSARVGSAVAKAPPPRWLPALLVFAGLLLASGLAFALVVWPGVRAQRRQAALNANNRGIEAMNQARFDEAGSLFHQALRLDPSLGIAMNNLGMLFERQGRIPQAESVFTATLRRFRNDGEVKAQALYNLGTIDLDTGAWESAVKNLGASFELDSSTARAYNNYGLALARQGRAEDALEVLTRGIRRFPVAAPLHKNAALALIGLGRPREALPHLDRALAIDSTYAEARTLREQAARAHSAP